MSFFHRTSILYHTSRKGLPASVTLKRWLQAAGVTPRDTIALCFVNEKEGRAFNKQFAQRDYATNVLSFSYSLKPLAGDIILCVPVLMREARMQGKSLHAHVAHLLIHGVLHLKGLHHHTNREARQMEAREITILKRLGFGNPYEY